MPYGFSGLGRVTRVTKNDTPELKKILESLCSKGLVIDLCIDDTYHYMPSPIVVGIFEFTLMRTGEDVNSKNLGHLFHGYFQADNGVYYTANAERGEKVSVIRALPH
jgi:hypothetical protein